MDVQSLPFFAYLALNEGEKSWSAKNGNLYVITRKSEYLFAENIDELYKTLLGWEKNGYKVYWYVAQQKDYDEFGKDFAGGWWEISASTKVPDWFKTCLFEYDDKVQHPDISIDIVERLARASLFSNDYNVGLYIYDRGKSACMEDLNEWCDEEATV